MLLGDDLAKRSTVRRAASSLRLELLDRVVGSEVDVGNLGVLGLEEDKFANEGRGAGGEVGWGERLGAPVDGDEGGEVLDDQVGEVGPGGGVGEVGEGEWRLGVGGEVGHHGGRHHREAELVVEGVDVGEGVGRLDGGARTRRLGAHFLALERIDDALAEADPTRLVLVVALGGVDGERRMAREVETSPWWSEAEVASRLVGDEVGIRSAVDLDGSLSVERLCRDHADDLRRRWWVPPFAPLRKVGVRDGGDAEIAERVGRVVEGEGVGVAGAEARFLNVGEDEGAVEGYC